MLDWDDYKPFFRKQEFDCVVTGQNRMRPEFMEVLHDIRKTYNKPMIITSGYRSDLHPAEIKKDKPGEHYYGCAADIHVYGTQAMDLMVIAYGYGIRRIGISQKGDIRSRFIHLGMGDKLGLNFPSTVWSY